eukprot:Colp12_sorted_trinity150504_noHs@22307
MNVNYAYWLAFALSVAAEVIICYWMVHYEGGVDWAKNVFNWHPILEVTGFVVVFSNAILLYKLVPFERSTTKIIHMLMQITAFVLGTIGIVAVFKFHDDNNIPNMYSLHSWFGISTIVLFGLQGLGGFLTYLFPGASPPNRKAFSPWHMFFGLFIYILAMATVVLGILEKMTFNQLLKKVDRFSSFSMLANSLGMIVFALAAVTIWIGASNPQKVPADASSRPLLSEPRA